MEDYKHGVYSTEANMAMIAVAPMAGVPVVFGTAPVHLSKLAKLPVNEPVLCNSFAQAKTLLGYSDDWDKYTLCEVMHSHFLLYKKGPVVFVSVIDPAVHNVAGEALVTTKDGKGVVPADGVILSSIVVSDESETTTYQLGEDYTVQFDNSGHVVLTVVAEGDIPSGSVQLSVSFNKLAPELVLPGDVIGGISAAGDREGLELIHQVYPRFRLVPGQIVAPKWSTIPAVASAMVAKAELINGHFRCLALTDVPTSTVRHHADVAAWKRDNKQSSTRQVVCWPMVTSAGKVYHLSTQLAGVMAVTDSDNDEVPFVSPSNKKLQADGAVLADRTTVFLGPDEAAALNGVGVVTALNFVEGWRMWGNRTAAYPDLTEPKDSFMPVRRMFDWLSNTIILKYWSRLDDPISKRLVEAITDDVNIWLNGLTARGALLGGRIEFNSSDNPVENLVDGKISFRVYVTPPSPAREIHFTLEYDAQALGGIGA